ncbi:MAG: 50S ribosomal protein L22 [Candidatus Sungbacteria bacterium]|nr:50S ribosomal protein L22 [Candidatus Sungbacteria bacterium]
MEVTAKLRHLHIAPRKVRLVAGLIRGLPYTRAVTQLAHLPRRASHPVIKLLKSAAANAKHNFNLDENNLFVKQILVDSGPVAKRIEPRAFGRGAVIRKRMSHVTVTLDSIGSPHQKSVKPKKSKPEVLRASPEELGDILREETSRAAAPKAEQHVKTREGVKRRFFQRKSV